MPNPKSLRWWIFRYPSQARRNARHGRVLRDLPLELADMAIAMLRNGYLTSKVITLDGGIVPRN